MKYHVVEEWRRVYADFIVFVHFVYCTTVIQLPHVFPKSHKSF